MIAAIAGAFLWDAIFVDQEGVAWIGGIVVAVILLELFAGRTEVAAGADDPAFVAFRRRSLGRHSWALAHVDVLFLGPWRMSGWLTPQWLGFVSCIPRTRAIHARGEASYPTGRIPREQVAWGARDCARVGRARRALPEALGSGLDRGADHGEPVAATD